MQKLLRHDKCAASAVEHCLGQAALQQARHFAIAGAPGGNRRTLRLQPSRWPSAASQWSWCLAQRAIYPAQCACSAQTKLSLATRPCRRRQHDMLAASGTGHSCVQHVRISTEFLQRAEPALTVCAVQPLGPCR
jgi:hypothetical protein